MRYPPRSASGFTLIELLIVVAIILVLMGMTVAIGITIKQKTKELQTRMRMEQVLNGLTQYTSTSGSIALTLQQTFGLGGVAQFATLQSIDSVTPNAASSQPPGIRYYWNHGGWATEDLNSTNWQTLSGGGGSTYGFELQSAWTRYSRQVMDVMPATPTVTYPTAQWLTWWPTQWPWTDWDSGSPGSNPPILRFPWGKPGLRTNGTLCDPESPVGVPTTNPQTVYENQTSGGSLYTTQVVYQVANNWATMGAPAAGAPYAWACNDATQTDYVTLTSATRSDGSTVPSTLLGANLPMPFDLGFCTPLQTIALLQAAGVVPPGTAGAASYRSDRSPKRPWNDAWGNPLVVVYAIFQPERYFRGFDQYNRRDMFLRQATASYGFNRALYVAVAAVGPTLPSDMPVAWGQDSTDSSNDSAAVISMWHQVRQVCNAVQWTESAWLNPPWQGTRVVSQGSNICLLTAPITIQ